MFFLVTWNSIMYVLYVFITHSLADGHLGWFHCLAIVNRAVVNNDMPSVSVVGQNP